MYRRLVNKYGNIQKSCVTKFIQRYANDKLQKCYRSRRASLIAGETIGIWKDMIGAYKEFVDCSEHPKAAEAVCEAHMNEEIAHRFFKIINMSNDLCELFGVKRDDRE